MMVFLSSFAFRLITKTPLNFDLTCLISRKIMAGLNRDKLSKITFGDPSVNDGRIKILF